MAEGEDALTEPEKEIVKSLQSTPKYLPVWYRYNKLGSKLCYDCSLIPGYYLTSAERSLVENHAERIIIETLSSADRESSGGLDTKHVNIVELGAGIPDKTRILLTACLRQGLSVKYFPIDLDGDTLRHSCDILEEEFKHENIELCPIGGFYGVGLEAVSTILSAGSGHAEPFVTLVLFLGSSLGSLPLPDQIDLLSSVRRHLPSSLTRLHLLIGVDLTQDERTLEGAYGGSNPTAEAFQLNGIRRLAEDFGGEVHVDDFHLKVTLHKTEQENFLTQMAVAKRNTVIELKKAVVRLEVKEGEEIRLSEGKNTNSKWNRQQWQSILDKCQFETENNWSVTENGIDYALFLLKPMR